jgi:hypothetical protein
MSNHAYNWIFRYNKPQQGITYIDPRIPLARHIEWSRPSTSFTDFSTPEPDNYNYAVLADRAYDCDFIRNQVFYHDVARRGWIGLYMVSDVVNMRFVRWYNLLAWRAVWHNRRYVPVRPRRSLLWNRAGSSEYTDNELLYTMGYYRNFIHKYDLNSAHNEFIQDVLGVPRGILNIAPIQDELENEYD